MGEIMGSREVVDPLQTAYFLQTLLDWFPSQLRSLSPFAPNIDEEFDISSFQPESKIEHLCN